VNSKVPVENGDAAFDHPRVRDGKESFWPLILEKSWAKIFGNYKVIESGAWSNAVMSLTSAMVATHNHKDSSKQDIWNILTKGTKRHFPMGAGTGDESNPEKYAMVKGHAYAVLGAKMVDGQKAVRIFNPWHADHYKGALPNENHKDGKFDMTLDEYLDAFEVTEVAEVYKGYRTSSQTVRAKEGTMTGLYEFDISDDSPFTVSAHWPSKHTISPCKVPDPSIVLVVGKKDTWQTTLGNEEGRKYGVNANSAMVKTGPGTYVVFVTAKFKGDTWIPKIHLTVYAAERVTIAPSTMSVDSMLSKTLLPPCDEDITVTGKEARNNGVFKKSSKTLFGVPYYDSSDKKSMLYFDGVAGNWKFIGSHQWGQVQSGSHFVDSSFDRDKLGVCGQKDSATVGGFDDLTCTDVKNKKFGNIACEDSENKATVHRYCPETCRKEKEKKDSFDPASVTPSCDEIVVSGQRKFSNGLYLKKSETLKGVSIFKALNGKSVMYYKEDCEAWSIIPHDQFDDVKQGSVFTTACFKKEDVKCGRHDVALVAPFGVGCDVVKKHTYGYINCKSVDVQRYCSETCKAHIQLSDASVPVLEGATEDSLIVPSGAILLGISLMATLAFTLRSARMRGSGASMLAADLILQEPAEQVQLCA